MCAVLEFKTILMHMYRRRTGLVAAGVGIKFRSQCSSLHSLLLVLQRLYLKYKQQKAIGACLLLLLLY
jgi:hypothetical protein